MANIDEENLKILLNKGWMTHDAMWVAAAFQELGAETTNKLNQAAVKGMSRVEAKRLKQYLNIGRVESFSDLKRFIQGAIEVIDGGFINFSLDFSEHNKMRWKTTKCFAFEGVSKLGMIDQYQCGVIPRIEGWLRALDIPYSLQPEIKGCEMYHKNKCEIEFHFNFV